MDLSHRRAVQTARLRTGCWHILLAVAVALTGCGARGLQSTGGDAGEGGGARAGDALSTGGANAGGALSTGGAGLGGTHDIIVSTGRGGGGVIAQAASADSGVIAQGGSDGGGEDGLCDMAALQYAVQDAAIHGGLGMCVMYSDPALSSTYGQPWGAIFIDGEGRLVVATGPAQRLVYTLADQRWTCVAGSNFLYWCSIAP